MASEIRALSVRQPWAWAICASVKKTENRSWTTEHRGTIAIHASTSPQAVNRFRKASGCDLMHRDYFTFGAIIGLADIADVSSYGQQHEDDPFAEGPYCWTMENGRLLSSPIALPGKLNLFKLSPKIQNDLRIAKTVRIDLLTDHQSQTIANTMTGSPDPIASYTELVQEHWRTSNHLNAMANAGDRLVKLAPNEAVGYMIQADLRLNDEDANDCSKLLRRAVELAPKLWFAWHLLTIAYCKEKQYEQATIAADQLVELAPDEALSFEMRARTYYYNKQYQQSIWDLDSALRIKPDSYFLLGLRAETKVAAGDHAGAKADIEEALRLSPNDKTTLELRHKLFGVP